MRMIGKKILSVDRWGIASVWTAVNNAFYGCTNLSIPATDAPNLIICTSMRNMFRSATNFNSPIDHWNVSNITDMDALFRSASNFNQPINTWNVSIVSDMSDMFRNATAFDQPLASWNVSSVMTMSNMFDFALAFNQPLALMGCYVSYHNGKYVFRFQ